MASLFSSPTTTPSILALLVAIASFFFLLYTNRPSTTNISLPSDLSTIAMSSSPTAAAVVSAVSSTFKRMPAYFISHGGPPTIFEPQSSPYLQWVKTGKEIQALNPRGLVVVSAHWENDDTGSKDVLINEVSQTPLIYDFYGFPPKFYEQKFNSVSQPWLVELTKKKLKEGGVGVTGVGGKGRGLDHGAWIPFKVLFPDHKPSSFPIVQVSLPGDSSAESSIKLGLALEKLRDEGVVVVGSGQSVHALRELMMGNRPSSYGKEFMSAISSLVASPTRLSDAPSALLTHKAYKRSHPSPEHLLPLFVAMGAGGEGSKGTVVWEKDEFAMGWQVLRFD
ncbi:Extradiol ring-cleavage dioxygenase, class III enzyme, subunit B [Mrakia frigida]|uniref:DODA-type extradiol aromatic ring-opening family dioxygenase n=1 Tax=Mrakia frigida TaxID=29902 RepID=UPI003FCC1FA3